MNITPGSLSAIFLAFDKRFQDAFTRAAKWADKVSTTVPSSTRELRYAWQKMLPRMREWLGERVVNNVAARGQTIVNKKYELTVEVSRDDIEDDQIGLYSMQMSQMGDEAALWPEDLVKNAIQAGVTNLSFDGQPFFSASHPIDMDNAGLGTYANNFPVNPLNPANYNAVRAAMMSYQGEDLRPLKVNPRLLVVPPQLEAAARQILNAEFIAPAGAFGANAAGLQSNVLNGSADLLVLPDLADQPDTWYLLDVSRPVKPFIFQLRSAPQMVMLIDPQSENVFWRDAYIYGVRARGASGYSLPWLAARSKNT